MAMVMKRCTEDCLDEALCPSDFEFAGSVVDDDMSRWLTVLPPHQLFAVCDCLSEGRAQAYLRGGLLVFLVPKGCGWPVEPQPQAPRTRHYRATAARSQPE